ncbi:MAG: hypothetical protein ACPG51_04755 [Thiolinea sp.]
MKKHTSSKLLVSPAKLFVFAQAFRFSSGRGQCFSPGIRSLSVWHASRLQHAIVDRSAMKWWRVWLEKI